MARLHYERGAAAGQGNAAAKPRIPVVQSMMVLPAAARAEFAATAVVTYPLAGRARRVRRRLSPWTSAANTMGKQGFPTLDLEKVLSAAQLPAMPQSATSILELSRDADSGPAEYAIPIEQAAKAIDETRRLVLQADYRVNFPLEVRFVAGDDIPMSPANGRDSCYIGAYVGSLEWAPPYFADFENLMRDYRGRPHWGKSFSITHDEIRALYPAYNAFDRLRRQCDPRGLFRNSFVDRVFPD